MSQKTGEGLLNEEEVKNYLNETFNIKINRDALINPKKDMVVDLYTRFLDFRNPNWRRYRNPKATVPSIMVIQLYSLLRGYTPNDKRDFHLGDLVMPDRRRTNYFLNALIYIKAQVDDILQDCQQWEADFKSDQDIAQELYRDLEEAKRGLENAAIIKSQARSVDEVKEDIKNVEALVRKLEFESVELEKEKLRLKESLQRLAANREILEEAIKTHKEQCEEKESLLRSLDDCKNLQATFLKIDQRNQDLIGELEQIRKADDDLSSKIAVLKEYQRIENLNEDSLSKFAEKKTTVENETEKQILRFNNDFIEENSLWVQIQHLESLACKTQLQAKISEEQAEANSKEAKLRRQKDFQRISGEINALNESLVDLEKTLVKFKEDRNKSNKQYEDYIEKLKHKREIFLQSHEKSVEADQEASKELQKLDDRINELLGNLQYSAATIRENLPADQSLPANRTYTIN